MLSNRFMTLPEPFEAVSRRMDQEFDILGNGGPAVAAQAPVALWEDDENVYLEVEVPGIRQEDLDLTVENGRLFISGERKPTKDRGKRWFDERHYGRFERVIALSKMIDPDSIEAELRDGLLALTLHKKPEAQPHRITVRAAGQPRLNEEVSEPQTEGSET